MKKRKCGFEQREKAAEKGYWKDPRWAKVRDLRMRNKNAEANGIVFKIRKDWGVE